MSHCDERPAPGGQDACEEVVLRRDLYMAESGRMMIALTDSTDLLCPKKVVHATDQKLPKMLYNPTGSSPSCNFFFLLPLMQQVNLSDNQYPCSGYL